MTELVRTEVRQFRVRAGSRKSASHHRSVRLGDQHICVKMARKESKRCPMELFHWDNPPLIVLRVRERCSTAVEIDIRPWQRQDFRVSHADVQGNFYNRS